MSTEENECHRCGASHVSEEEWVGAEGGEDEEVKKKGTPALHFAEKTCMRRRYIYIYIYVKSNEHI